MTPREFKEITPELIDDYEIIDDDDPDEMDSDEMDSDAENAYLDAEAEKAELEAIEELRDTKERVAATVRRTILMKEAIEVLDHDIRRFHEYIELNKDLKETQAD